MSTQPSPRDANAPAAPHKLPTWYKLLAVVGVLVIGYRGIDCGYNLWGHKVLARVPIARAGEPAEVPVSLAAGRRVNFAVAAAHVRSTGANQAHFEIHALRRGASVANVACSYFRSTGRRGASSVLSYDDTCQLVVPPGGADAVRVRMQFDNQQYPIEFTGLEVRVRQTHW